MSNMKKKDNEFQREKKGMWLINFGRFAAKTNMLTVWLKVIIPSVTALKEKVYILVLNDI